MRSSVLLLPALLAMAPSALPSGGPLQLLADDFEQEGDWQSMEELAGPCYGIGLGSAQRHATAARTGGWGFQAFANEADLPLSNHVFGAYRVSEEAHVAPLRYEVWATRDPLTNDTTQAGPEFGVQVTHEYPEGWRTTSFGFQYVGSPYHPPSWFLWVEDELLPGVAEWRAVHERPLAAGAWHRFVLEADLTVPEYRSLLVEGPGWSEHLDLAGLAIAREVKWQEAATWVSLDADNLWSNCGVSGTFQARVWYDDVRLERLEGP